MDPNAMVTGGSAGLRAIADAFRMNNFAIQGIYLIKITSDEGYEDWVVRLITSKRARDMINLLVRLRREKQLPAINSRVRFDVIQADDAEASRIIEYSRRMGDVPVEINGALIDGMFIEYALVADYPGADAAAA
jgi:hypothetical protein